METTIKTIPKEKEDIQSNEKIRKVFDIRNRIIAKKLGVEADSIGITMYYNTGSLISKLGVQDKRLGVFSGYVDYEKTILIAHPLAIEPIFSEKLDESIQIMIDDTLYKYYFCHIFYPNPSDFKLFYKHFTAVCSKILSGNFNKQSIDFEIKNYDENKRYTKQQEIEMALLVMFLKSDSDFIISNLKTFFEDTNIKKSILTIYKKEFKELIRLYQLELIAEEKKLKKVFRRRR